MKNIERNKKDARENAQNYLIKHLHVVFLLGQNWLASNSSTTFAGSPLPFSSMCQARRIVVHERVWDTEDQPDCVARRVQNTPSDVQTCEAGGACCNGAQSKRWTKGEELQDPSPGSRYARHFLWSGPPQQRCSVMWNLICSLAMLTSHPGCFKTRELCLENDSKGDTP